MEYTFSYHIIIGVIFTDQEFDFLSKLISQNKDTAYAMQQGRFWATNTYRRKKYREGKKDQCPVTLTIKQLEQVILKSLEPYILHGHEDQHELEFASRLYYQLYKIAEDAISEANILNESRLPQSTGIT